MSEVKYMLKYMAWRRAIGKGGGKKLVHVQVGSDGEIDGL